MKPVEDINGHNYYQENIDSLNNIYKYYNPSIYYNNNEYKKFDNFIMDDLTKGVLISEEVLNSNSKSLDYMPLIILGPLVMLYVILISLLIYLTRKNKKEQHR